MDRLPPVKSPVSCGCNNCNKKTNAVPPSIKGEITDVMADHQTTCLDEALGLAGLRNVYCDCDEAVACFKRYQEAAGQS